MADKPDFRKMAIRFIKKRNPGVVFGHIIERTADNIEEVWTEAYDAGLARAAEIAEKDAEESWNYHQSTKDPMWLGRFDGCKYVAQAVESEIGEKDAKEA